MSHEIIATILPDKSIFSCTSTVNDNFDEALKCYPELSLEKHLTFGNTTLIQTTDISFRYKYSYIANYKDYKMGQIYFGQFGRLWNDRIKFTVDNPVFYNNTQPYLSHVMEDLNLKVENFTNIDIAIDSYNFNSEQVLRRNLRNKENQVRLFHAIIRDRTKAIDNILGFNKPSLNNFFKERGITIKDKKGTKEYSVYDKLAEVDYSGKDYILDFHKTKNQNLKNLYRSEVRFVDNN